MYDIIGKMAELQIEFENSEYRCVERFVRNYNNDKEKQQNEIKRKSRFNLTRNLIKRLLKHKLNK